MSNFVSALGPGSGVRALSLQPFGPLTSVGLKELFLKTTVLLDFASAKRIEHLHAFSVDSDCIRFGPGDCSVTLRPRLEYVPKSLSTPFERTETVRRQPLLLIIALTECGRPDCSLPRQSVTLDCGRYHGGIYNPRFGKFPLHIEGYRST